MLKRYFMDRSLKTRITFLYTLFAIALVGVITFYTYSFTVDLLKKKESSILSDSLEYLEQRISAKLEAVNEEYINLFDDDKFLKLYLESAGSERALAEQMELNNDFRDYFMDLRIRNHDLIKSIQLISSSGDVYSDEYNPLLTYEEFVESPYYTLCMAEKNRILYYNPEPDSDYFSILRSFYFMNDPEEGSSYPGVGYISENNDDYSTLIFFMKKSYLRKMIKEEAKKRNTNVLILDEEGNVIVQEGNMDWMPQDDDGTLMQEMKDHLSEKYQGELKKGRIGVHMRPVSIAHWSIVYVYDMNILYKQAGQIRDAAWIIFGISVVVVFLIASFISGTVVKPIRVLGKAMDDAVENNMQVTFVPKYNDEIANLGRRFSALMKRVSELMVEVKRVEEQKRAEELKALQAQINPHFLYNTLDMVYWLAKMDHDDKIADLVAALADFFRLSLNKGEDITTVSREIEHVKKYLEIQRLRMDGKFDYVIDMEQEVADRKIPKLILQPIVENSLVHGFENISCQGLIEIKVRKEKEDIVFNIVDNGCGIERELLTELNLGSYSGKGSSGYAIGNVRDRLCLYAGTDYGVRFNEETEYGTSVEIRFPYEF